MAQVQISVNASTSKVSATASISTLEETTQSMFDDDPLKLPNVSEEQTRQLKELSQNITKKTFKNSTINTNFDDE